MLSWSCLLLPGLLWATLASAALPTKPADGSPTIRLDNGIFVGTSDGTVNRFLGIPFVKPPIGDLRYRLPVPNDAYTGQYNATVYGPACPQQNATTDVVDLSVLPAETIQFLLNNYSRIVDSEDEDCLTINVIAPVGTKPNAKLPVAFWIYGGGFSMGGASRYNGTVVVQRSIELGRPVVFVSLNYRLHGFGFLGSKEVKEAGVGNLGLQDQREALRWVQKYISSFGGDPGRVTIWGQSSGAISVSLQMLTNGGNSEGLFHGAFMQSGSPPPFGDISEGQAMYDFVVSEAGCQGAADTLQCLRETPYETLKATFNKTPGIFSYRSLHLTWAPLTDGKFLVDDAQKLVVQGHIAKVPFVTGDCDDEGTLFSLSTVNVTTEAELATYLRENYFPRISEHDLAALLEYYPANITQGSPFDTGTANAVTPEFKRHAAIVGDLAFQSTRRLFLQHTAAKQNVWMYLFKRIKSLPVLGSFHGMDTKEIFGRKELTIFGGKELTDYLVNFVNHLDPNGKSVPAWPQFTLESRKLLTLLDGDTPVTIGMDDYRVEGMELLTKVLLETPL